MVQAPGAADCNPVTSPLDIRLVTSAPLRLLGGDPGPHQADPLPATSTAPSPARDHSPPELSRGVGPLPALGHRGHADGRARGPAGRRSCTRRVGCSLDGGGTGCGGHLGPRVGSSGSRCQGPVAGHLLGRGGRWARGPTVGGAQGPPEGPGRGMERGPGERRAWGSIPLQPQLQGARGRGSPPAPSASRCPPWAAPGPQADGWEVVRWPRSPASLWPLIQVHVPSWSPR